jgi:Phage integrase, N-terminal SAM-like domain
MGYAENLGSYWRGRFKVTPGKYETVRDSTGETIKFRTKREAKQAADRKEADVAQNGFRRPADRRMTFGEYARTWYARQDLAASTMQNYRRHIENHLLPAFEDVVLLALTSEEVDLWEKRERAAGYAASSIKTWRSTLHLILSDAEAEERITSNPAEKRRGRGRRASRSRNRGPEKVVTDTLGLLLIAERAALLSGRDDEFSHRDQGHDRHPLRRTRRPGDEVRPAQQHPNRVAALRTGYGRADPGTAEGRILSNHRHSRLPKRATLGAHRGDQAEALPLSRPNLRLQWASSG